MTSLPDQTILEEEESKRYGIALRLSSEVNDSDLVWAIIPKLAYTLNGYGPQEYSHRAIATARNFFRSYGSRGPLLIKVGPVLFVSTSSQNLRVLSPIIKALVGSMGPQFRVHLPPLGIMEFLRIQHETNVIIRIIAEYLESNSCLMPSCMYEEALQTAIYIKRAKYYFSNSKTKVVVVGTQHNSATRAILRSAMHCRNVRTVYIPHAPVANNPLYRDLPVHNALLRGPAEVDFYSKLGVSVERQSVIGNAGLARFPMDVLPAANDTITFALSPLPKQQLMASIDVVADAGFERVEVSPHPLMNLKDLKKICPGKWAYNPLPSTFKRLESKGCLSLVQQGSGVGMEALELGIPVVDLCNPGRRPNYPYITPPHVDVVSSSEQLIAAVRNADRSEIAALKRQQYARDWCAYTMPKAVELAVEEISRLVDAPCSDSIALDAWAGDT